jgi:hypothetical protein
MESPEHWFEDFGAATLKAGRVVVKIDADFARVVKLDEYHVFVTPADDCRGLCVRNKTATSFEVRELAGGKSSVAFSYRIVARRKDIKAHQRFAKIDRSQALPAPATRPPREPAPTAAALREFVAQLEKEARTGGRPLPLPTDLSKEFPVSAAASRRWRRRNKGLDPALSHFYGEARAWCMIRANARWVPPTPRPEIGGDGRESPSIGAPNPELGPALPAY